MGGLDEGWSPSVPPGKAEVIVEWTVEARDRYDGGGELGRLSSPSPRPMVGGSGGLLEAGGWFW